MKQSETKGVRLGLTNHTNKRAQWRAETLDFFFPDHFSVSLSLGLLTKSTGIFIAKRKKSGLSSKKNPSVSSKILPISQVRGRERLVITMSWIRTAVNKAVEAGGRNTRTVRDYAGYAVSEGAKIIHDRIVIPLSLLFLLHYFSF